MYSEVVNIFGPYHTCRHHLIKLLGNSKSPTIRKDKNNNYKKRKETGKNSDYKNRLSAASITKVVVKNLPHSNCAFPLCSTNLALRFLSQSNFPRRPVAAAISFHRKKRVILTFQRKSLTCFYTYLFFES